MELLLLKDIVVIFGLSIAVLLIGHRFGVPTIVGYLITGIVGGPHALGLVSGAHDVEVLAEIGIVLLLFSIGMDFSIRGLAKFRRFFLGGGILQVGLTILATFIFALALGRPPGESLFLGFLISLSSTAIVLGILGSKGELSTPHGRFIIAVAIFQDLAAVPMILLTPLLAGIEIEINQYLFIDIFLGLVLVALVIISADKVIPRFLFLITRTRSKELFLLSVLTICFAVAWVSSLIGLSISLGAFLAGLTISESEYSNEAIGDILPFKDIFTSFFFVSIGMTLDIGFVFQQPFTILIISLAIILLKTITGGLATIGVGMPLRTAVLAGIGLAQIGEFSFVLARSGFDYGLASDEHYQLFLAVALLTMALSPSMINLSPTIANWVLKLPFPSKLKTGIHPLKQKMEASKSQHVIIIGFGISGRYLARACKLANIPYIILEMNPETVREEKVKGEPIHFGDATHESVLLHVNIREANAVAIVINDPVATRQIAKVARNANPSLYIIARTRFLTETKMMQSLGVDDVIPDDFGTSIEIFSRVMHKYHVPLEEIEKVVNDVREEGHELLSKLHKIPQNLNNIDLSKVEIQIVRVEKESIADGKNLSELSLRKDLDITVLLVRRNLEIITSLSADTKLEANDILVVVGPNSSFIHLPKFFKALQVRI